MKTAAAPGCGYESANTAMKVLIKGIGISIPLSASRGIRRLDY